jgi:hypothetical protein
MTVFVFFVWLKDIFFLSKKKEDIFLGKKKNIIKLRVILTSALDTLKIFYLVHANYSSC